MGTPYKIDFKASTILGLLILPIAAYSAPNNIPKQVLDACLKASDFQGCVNVMTGENDFSSGNKDYSRHG